MEELNIELNRMYKEVEDLKGVISDLKTEKTELKGYGTIVVNLEASRSRYQQTLNNKQKMEKELLQLENS